MTFKKLSVLVPTRKRTKDLEKMLEIKAQTGSAELVFTSLSNYKPPETTEPDQIWPPSVACNSWNNETPPHAIHYSKQEIRQVLNVMYKKGIDQGEILVSDYRDGLPSLFWGKVFSKVVSVCQRALDHEPIVDSNQTILFGTPGDTRFLYKVMEHISNLKAILLDETYYANIISPYFLFRKMIRPPGIIIFMNTAQKVPEHAGVHRFLTDLSSGFLDNRKHNIVHVHDDPDGYGISYELVV